MRTVDLEVPIRHQLPSKGYFSREIVLLSEHSHVKGKSRQLEAVFPKNTISDHLEETLCALVSGMSLLIVYTTLPILSEWNPAYPFATNQ